MSDAGAQRARSAVEETVAITGRMTGNVRRPPPHSGRPRNRAAFMMFPSSSTGDLSSLPRPLEVQCADTLANDVEATLRAGDRVVIVGRLRSVTWRTASGAECLRTLLLAKAIGLSVEDAPEVVA